SRLRGLRQLPRRGRHLRQRPGPAARTRGHHRPLEALLREARGTLLLASGHRGGAVQRRAGPDQGPGLRSRGQSDRRVPLHLAAQCRRQLADRLRRRRLPVWGAAAIGSDRRGQTSRSMSGRASVTLALYFFSSALARAWRASSSPCTRATGGRPAMAPYHSISPAWPACADRPPTVWRAAWTRISSPNSRTVSAPSTRRRPSVPWAW